MLKAEKGPLDECFRVHLFHFRSQQRGGSGGGREAAAVIHHAEVNAEAKPKLAKERKTATSRHLRHFATHRLTRSEETRLSFPKTFQLKMCM